MQKKPTKKIEIPKLINSVSQILSAIRYGNFNHNLNTDIFKDFPDLMTNLNKMIESIQDRELMIKEYQSGLNEQKEYLEILFNSLNDALITTTEECKIIRYNKKFLNLVGMTEADIIGKNFLEFIETKTKNNFKIEQINNNIKIKGINAQQNTYSLSCSKIELACGTANFVILLRDITKELEIEELRKNFIATLTHDLRVPILAETNTIKLFLKDTFGALNEKQKEALLNMLESNNELIMLVNSLLDVYKIENGTYEIIKEEINLNNICEEILSEFKFSLQKFNKQIKLSMMNNLPLVYADKKDIKRVIRNLIDNAITHTPTDGIIEIETFCKKKFVYLAIKDTGNGIPKIEMDKIFDRYYSSAKKFRKIGTGLGLFLSKAIIEKHNGKIDAKSSSKGSIFKFSLPI